MVALCRTTEILEAVTCESEHHPRTLQMAVGDYNASACRLEGLRNHIHKNHWVDVGAVASRLEVPTSSKLAKHMKDAHLPGTTTSYAIYSVYRISSHRLSLSWMLPPVHSCIDIWFRRNLANAAIRVNCVPPSMFETIEKAFLLENIECTKGNKDDAYSKAFKAFVQELHHVINRKLEKNRTIFDSHIANQHSNSA